MLDRLQKFNELITPTFIWGCESWTMSRYSAEKARTAQRFMLRRIIWLGPPPEFEEEDEDISVGQWWENTTKTIEDLAGRVNVRDWVLVARERKWKYAGQLASRQMDSWVRDLLNWYPQGLIKRGVSDLVEDRRHIYPWHLELQLQIESETSPEKKGPWIERAKENEEKWESMKGEFARMELAGRTRPVWKCKEYIWERPFFNVVKLVRVTFFAPVVSYPYVTLVVSYPPKGVCNLCAFWGYVTCFVGRPHVRVMGATRPTKNNNQIIHSLNTQRFYDCFAKASHLHLFGVARSRTVRSKGSQ